MANVRYVVGYSTTIAVRVAASDGRVAVRGRGRAVRGQEVGAVNSAGPAVRSAGVSVLSRINGSR